MATFLYRLGRAAYGRRRVVLLGWVLLLAVLGGIARMTIVPAVMALLGERAWYLPRWLDRVLPDVDLEGSRLREHTPHGWDRGTATAPAEA